MARPVTLEDVERAVTRVLAGIPIHDDEQLDAALEAARERIISSVRQFNFARDCDLMQERSAHEREMRKNEAELRRLMTGATKAQRFNAKGHFVYQLHNAAGEVIYVGVTSSLMNRLHAHITDKKKRDHIHRVTWVEAESRIDAEQIEFRLIRSLQPAFNSNHNPKAA